MTERMIYMPKNIKAALKKIITIACTLTVVFSLFGVSALDVQTVIDESDLLSAQTEQYIEENIKNSPHMFGGITRFAAEPTDKMVTFNEHNTILGRYFSDMDISANLNATVIVWADGANEMKSFSLTQPKGDMKNYNDVKRLINKQIKKTDDRQTAIRDAFSIFLASRYYYYDSVENIPDTLTVSGIDDLGAYVKSELDKATFYRNTFGIVVGIAIIAALVVFFARRKTPEGTVPGDGSNFKEGLGSGVAAMTGMPGQSGYTTGMGALGAGPKG